MKSEVIRPNCKRAPWHNLQRRTVNSPGAIGSEVFPREDCLASRLATLTTLLLLLFCLCGCAGRQQFVGSRPFDFQTDTFAFANQLVWDYHYDDQGKWVHERHEPEPDYTHHCFVVTRSARQFFQHARFDPAKPIADEATYRRLIREVVSLDPTRVLSEENKIVIPGYTDLRAFSEAQEKLLKAECGGAWQSYFQRGHWRIVMPFSRASQDRAAKAILDDLKQNRPPVVHVIRFPQLTINHALLIFDARQTDQTIKFIAYDPNKPDKPKTLLFDRASRTFNFASNDYWPGGKLNVYEIYRSWLF